MEVKARKVGNSITLTVPKQFEVLEGQEYHVFLEENGSIRYEPKRKNIFEGNWFNEDLNQVDVTLPNGVMDSEWS